MFVHDRHAAQAGILGALLWLFALCGFVFGEIEYNDPTRPSPIPEWASALALGVGAALIGAMLWSLRRSSAERGTPGRAGISVALVGSGLALVPLWPMIFFGPLLVALGMAGRGFARIKKGDAGAASWIHALGVPIGLMSGMALDAIGVDNTYSGLVLAVALCGGLIWLACDMITGDRTSGPLVTKVGA